MTIKAVLFDLDDTLYGDFKTCDKLGLKAAGEYLSTQIDITPQKATEAMNNGRNLLRKHCPFEPEMHDRTLFAKWGLEQIGINPMKYAKTMNDIYWNTVIDNIVIHNGVHNLLTKLKNENIPVGICTNMLADVQMKKLCKLGIDEICGLLITSEDAGKDKPSSKIFDFACKKLNSIPSQTLMVGDSIEHDIIGALNFNMPALWINWKLKSIPQLEKPFFVSNTFEQAADKIIKLCNLK